LKLNSCFSILLPALKSCLNSFYLFLNFTWNFSQENKDVRMSFMHSFEWCFLYLQVAIDLRTVNVVYWWFSTEQANWKQHKAIKGGISACFERVSLSSSQVGVRGNTFCLSQNDIEEHFYIVFFNKSFYLFSFFPSNFVLILIILLSSVLRCKIPTVSCW